MFERRETCPCCQSARIKRYLSLPYSHGVVHDFLYEYYKLNIILSDLEIKRIFSDVNYSLCECEDCRLLFQEFVPNDEFATIIYGTWIGHGLPEGDRAYDFGEFSHWMGEAMRLTSQVLMLTGKRSPQHLRVLDFGMGHGIFARAMIACGCQVAGYDLAEGRQTLAETSGIRAVSYAEIAEDRFDFINTEQVFEHVTRPLEVVRYLVSALNPGGILKISVPYNRWIEKGDLEIDWSAGRYARRSYMPLQPLEHVNYFRRPSLFYLCNKNGLTKINESIFINLKYCFEWPTIRGFTRNLARALFRDKFRNHYIFQKK